MLFIAVAGVSGPAHVFRLIRISVLFLLLSLAGCSQDFAELSFNTQVQPEANRYSVGRYSSGSQRYAVRDEIGLIYQEQLDLLLISAGISPQEVRYRLVPPGRKVILSGTGFFGLPQEKKNALRDVINAHFQQRKHLLNANFSLSAANADSAAPQHYSRNIRLRYLILSLVPDPYAPLDIVLQQISDYSRPRQVYCHLTIGLDKALPFRALHAERGPDGQISGYYLQGPANDPSSQQRYPVQMQFESRELQKGFDSGRFSLMMPVSWRKNPPPKDPALFSGIDRLEIRLMALGDYPHQQPQIDSGSHRYYLRQCEEKIRTFNAPFHYAFGDSLNRLQQVRFY